MPGVFSVNFCTWGPESAAMPMMVASSPSSRARLARSGISRMHGGHQVAQKLITTGLPFRALMSSVLPPKTGRFRPASVSSGVWSVAAA